MQFQISRAGTCAGWRCAGHGQLSGGGVRPERRNAIEVVVGNEGERSRCHWGYRFGGGDSTTNQKSHNKQRRDQQPEMRLHGGGPPESIEAIHDAGLRVLREGGLIITLRKCKPI